MMTQAAALQVRTMTWDRFRAKFPSISRSSDELKDRFEKSWNPLTGEVTVTCRLSPKKLIKMYKRITPLAEWAKFKVYCAKNEGIPLIFVGATYAGGGVAIMRMVLIALLQAMGVNVRWLVMKPLPEAFEVTKHSFHDTFQDVNGQVELTEERKDVYEAWIADNAILLEPALRSARVIVIDDWQPSGLIDYILGDSSKGLVGFNPDAEIIFRDHIATEGGLMSTPGTSQRNSWLYVWKQIQRARIMIFHPRPELFVPDDVPQPMVALMGATSDLLDDLNRKMTRRERRAGIRYLNEHFATNGHQTPLDLKRKIYVLIARFDPSKGMDLGLAAWARHWQMLADMGVPLHKRPQLVIIGNGSIDDPAGPVILKEIMDQWEKLPPEIRNDAKIARVPHNDLAINALLWYAILALQTSTKEGFENRVTDALLHAVFVLGSTAGGIPLQILEGLTGHAIGPYETQEWARRMVEIATESWWSRYLRTRRVKKWTKRHNHQYTTLANAISWLYLSYTVATDPEFEVNGMSVYESAMAE